MSIAIVPFKNRGDFSIGRDFLNIAWIYFTPFFFFFHLIIKCRFQLNFNVPCISESYIETKIKLLLCSASKGFMKAFIKPFEASQRSVKIKI